MFSDTDDFFSMDYVLCSSPIADRSFDDSMQYDFEIGGNYDQIGSMEEDIQRFTHNNASPVKEFTKENVLQKVNEQFDLKKLLSPKPKKKPVVFKPFASFDATELTVQYLRDRIKEKNSHSLYL